MIAAAPRTAPSAKPAWLALLGAAVLFLAGCASFNETYVYLPRPVQVTTTIPGVPAMPTPPGVPGAPGAAAVPGEGSVRALVSIIGINEISGKAQEPPAIKVRMRVWNHTNAPVTFNPGSLVLVAADTSLFPAPTVEPAAPFDLAPGQSAEATAVFPVPGGKVSNGHDLTALTLQWSVQVAGRTVPQSALFQRYRRVPYYAPYYYYNDPWWPGYGGFYLW